MKMSAVRRRSLHAGAGRLVRLRSSSLSLLLLVVLRGRHSADSAPAPAGTHRFLAAIAGGGSGGGGTGTSGSHRQTSANDPCYDDDDSMHSLFTSRLITPRPFRNGWLGSRVVNVLDSGAEGPGFKSQPRRCRITVLGELFTPIVPLFTKQQNW